VWLLIARAISALELLAGGSALTFVLVYVVVHNFTVTWPFVAYTTMYGTYHMGRAMFREFLRSKMGNHESDSH
jgi:hypothetical protein